MSLLFFFLVLLGGNMTEGNMDNLWHCPNCGESHFTDDAGYTTLLYFQPIWKDGKNINPDKNITTFNRHCLACGKLYCIQLGYDFYKITEIESPSQIQAIDTLEIQVKDTLYLLRDIRDSLQILGTEIECDTTKKEVHNEDLD